MEEYVYNLLEDEGLERLPVPKSSPPELQTFIFASKDALKRNKKLMIFIHGSGVVRAGQWARRLIINENLYSGTQIPYIRKAKRLGYEILVLNTNDNYRMYKGKKTKIPVSVYFNNSIIILIVYGKHFILTYFCSRVKMLTLT